MRSLSPGQPVNLRHLVLGLLLMSTTLNYCLAQGGATNAGQDAEAKVAGISFSVPQGFKLEQSSNSRIAFMRNPEISLFVAVPEKQVDDKYLLDLSNALASQLRPGQTGLIWKLKPAEASKRSKYQTGRGSVQGLNSEFYVQIDYDVVKMRGNEVVLGSIGTYGEGLEAAHFYHYDRLGYSFTGGSGRFHLLSSITGEKLDD